MNKKEIFRNSCFGILLFFFFNTNLYTPDT